MRIQQHQVTFDANNISRQSDKRGLDSPGGAPAKSLFLGVINSGQNK